MRTDGFGLKKDVIYMDKEILERLSPLTQYLIKRLIEEGIIEE